MGKLNKRIVERVSDFFNDNSVMSVEDFDNILLEVETETIELKLCNKCGFEHIG